MSVTSAPVLTFNLVSCFDGEPCRNLFASNCVQEGCIKYVLTADFRHSFTETLGTVISLLVAPMATCIFCGAFLVGVWLFPCDCTPSQCG